MWLSVWIWIEFGVLFGSGFCLVMVFLGLVLCSCLFASVLVCCSLLPLLLWKSILLLVCPDLFHLCLIRPCSCIISSFSPLLLAHTLSSLSLISPGSVSFFTFISCIWVFVTIKSWHFLANIHVSVTVWCQVPASDFQGKWKAALKSTSTWALLDLLWLDATSQFYI